MKVVAFDLETTGLSVKKDRIVSYSFILYDLSTGSIINKMTGIVNPMIPIPKEASDIHGITDDMVKDAPKLGEIAGSIVEFLLDYPIMGFNSNSYDIPLLYFELMRFGIKLNLDRQKVDVLEIEKILTKRDLHTVYFRYTGKNLLDNHGADADAMATIEILEAMVKKTTLIMDIDELASYSNFNKGSVDLLGYLKKNDKGEICWNLGKHNGKRVDVDMDYIKWFNGTPDGLPPDTLQMIMDEIRRINNI